MAAVAHGVVCEVTVFVVDANRVADMYHQILMAQAASPEDRKEVDYRRRDDVRASAMRQLRDKDGPFKASTVLVYGFPESVLEARLFLASGSDKQPALVIQLIMAEDEVRNNLCKHLEKEVVEICVRAWKMRVPNLRSVLNVSVEGVAFVTVSMEGRSIEDVSDEIAHLIKAHRQKLINEGR